VGSTIALADAARTETSYLPAGWEIKVVAGSAEPDAPAPAARLIAADEATGEVTAIVGVTGIVDHVNDLIEPGAYQDTLVKRRPKVCWAHSWEVPIGKVLRIEEWLPGDPRFAKVGAQLDGKAWPAEAGALVAHMQLNLKSDKGREAFAAVQFYSETGECEWSIGWQPIPAKTLRRKDGVRVCQKVELYEVSPVLFGAAPLTRTLEVKSLNLAAATERGVAPRVGVAAGTPDGYAQPEAPMADETVNEAAPQPGEAGVEVDEATLHRNAMGEIDWDEVDAAANPAAGASAAPGTPAAAANPGGQPMATDDDTDDDTDDGDDEESFEEAEDDEETPVDEDVDEESEDDEESDEDEDGKEKPRGAPPFTKKKDGRVAISAKSLTAFTDTLDLAALGIPILDVRGVESKAEGGADRNRGGAEQLRRWYVSGEGAMRISWGTPGDFSRCVGIAGQHMDPERAKGYCNLRHKDALGIYPATHAAQHRGGHGEVGHGVAGKAFAAARTLAKSWNPLLEVGVHAAHGRPERKFLTDGVDGLRGSFEQRQSKLREAIEPVLKAEVGWKKPQPTAGHDATPGDDCWVHIDGTWPDRVVATVCRYGEERTKQTFVVPYTFDGEEPSFGRPQPVELQVSIVPAVDGKPSADADELFADVVAEDRGLDGGLDGGLDAGLDDALMLPAISLLGSGIGAIKGALSASPEVPAIEGKAGRVLSEANASRLRGALEHLLEVARSAGIDLPGWTGPDELGRDETTLPDTTAPAGGVAPVAGRPHAGRAPGTAVKALTAADVEAQLTEIRNFLS
jgi:hypothetical protein